MRCTAAGDPPLIGRCSRSSTDWSAVATVEASAVDQVEVFKEVFRTVRFPYFAADLERLAVSIDQIVLNRRHAWPVIFSGKSDRSASFTAVAGGPVQSTAAPAPVDSPRVRR